MNDPAVDAYYKERIDNIKSQVAIHDILNHYGIKILTQDREFQYPCPLHGDGQDNSYSARMYPDSQSTYCWACHKSRDVVGWVCDAEGLGFANALSWIERTFSVKNVPRMTFDGNFGPKKIDLGLDAPKKGPSTMDIINQLDVMGSRALQNRREDLTWQKAVKVFFVLDGVRYDLQHGNIEDKKAVDILGKVYKAMSEWEKNDN